MQRGFRPACWGCGVRMDHCVKVYADLHGPAFQAYYCTPCAQGLRAREVAYKMADERDAEIMGRFVRLAFNAETRPRRMMLLSGLAGFEREVRAEDQDCARTMALWHPGERILGMRCWYSWGGRVPLTGRLLCRMCGREEPNRGANG